jgi:uncharacterized protein with HEPN domain
VPPTVEDRLLDILEAIADVDEILLGKSLEEFTADQVLRLATERLLEIVCEASRNLPDSVKHDAPDINWRKMIDFGNRLRHAYRETDVVVVWEIVQKHVPPLKSFVQRRIGALRK